MQTISHTKPGVSAFFKATYPGVLRKSQLLFYSFSSIFSIHRSGCFKIFLQIAFLRFFTRNIREPEIPFSPFAYIIYNYKYIYPLPILPLPRVSTAGTARAPLEHREHRRRIFFEHGGSFFEHGGVPCPAAAVLKILRIKKALHGRAFRRGSAASVNDYSITL